VEGLRVERLRVERDGTNTKTPKTPKTTPIPSSTTGRAEQSIVGKDVGDGVVGKRVGTEVGTEVGAWLIVGTSVGFAVETVGPLVGAPVVVAWGVGMVK
jgi:hypothetical protein